MKLRDAVIGDVGDLSALFVRSALSNDEHRDSLLQHPGALAFCDAAVHEGRARVVTIDGCIAAFTTTLVRDDVVEVNDLFVDPARMGQGLGRALVLDVVALARRHGIARIELTGNQRARGFYEKVGFTFDIEVATQFGSAPRMYLDVALAP